jgi:putative Ca2+/H+ antiporter (TMEM165/GDT1 family)
MTALFASIAFVVLAEMGDKSQLLGMAFAMRYRVSLVLWGVFVATALNHLFAVVVGSYLTKYVPVQYIQLAAAFSFIFFGLWTIYGDKLEGEDKKYSFSPFWTVTIAFFFIEMGDKTQLATVALAVKYQQLIPVWIGTTVGMVISNAFGILVVVVLGKRIPERFIKWGSTLAFIVFGVYGINEYTPAEILTPAVKIVGLVILAAVIYFVVRISASRKAGFASLEE